MAHIRGSRRLPPPDTHPRVGGIAPTSAPGIAANAVFRLRVV